MILRGIYYGNKPLEDQPEILAPGFAIIDAGKEAEEAFEREFDRISQLKSIIGYCKRLRNHEKLRSVDRQSPGKRHRAGKEV